MTGICGVGGKSNGVLLWFRTRKPTWSGPEQENRFGVNHLIVCWSGFGSLRSTVFDVMNRIPFV